ncbi:uncharacterized protein LOC131860219 [Cryptomeria japonica]|uniref:uncharacterized protein LOC131860219 n=1 Tax=Cryptomeria japonica TaxID=3369 RepID=UPI0027D9FE8D|nr:uncharacterized protein LOC131860219 [Cryptomeria japonica]
MVDNYVVRNPIFDGTNYAFWSIKVKAYLNALGYDVWQSMVDGYTPPSTPPTDTVMHCKLAKEIWNKLKGIYEGDEKVREAKLQSLRMKYESLKMKEDEDIAAYFLRVDEIVNAITSLGEEVEDTLLVQKLLRTLTMKFDPKVSAIEEMKDLKTLTKDELFGILTAYEMRREDKPSQKEVGHYASKCPQNESDSSEEEKKNYPKEKGKKYFKQNYSKHKKSFYSKQSSSSSEESSEDMSSSDGEEILFMVVKVEDDEDEKEEDQEAMSDEEDVDLEEELHYAYEQNEKLKGRVSKYKTKLQESRKLIKDLKIQLEEAKKTEKEIKDQLKSKEEGCSKLES